MSFSLATTQPLKPLDNELWETNLSNYWNDELLTTGNRTIETERTTERLEQRSTSPDHFEIRTHQGLRASAANEEKK